LQQFIVIANLRVPDLHLEALDCVAEGNILCLPTTMPIAEGRMQRAVGKTPLLGLRQKAMPCADLQVADDNQLQRGEGGR